MKRAHRRYHLAIWIVLAVMLALVLWAALAHRPAEPLNEALPSTLTGAAG